MAKLIKVCNQHRPGEESFEFTLSTEERELILKEVDWAPHVLDWVRHPRGAGGAYRLPVGAFIELYQKIESVAYMDNKSPKTQAALQSLVACLEEMEQTYAPEVLHFDPAQPCLCGSGRKFGECCGKAK